MADKEKSPNDPRIHFAPSHYKSASHPAFVAKHGGYFEKMRTKAEQKMENHRFES